MQSKWTMSHLLGLNAIESANSIPENNEKIYFDIFAINPPTLHPASELWADKRRSRVGSVNMEPELLLLANRPDLLEIVKSAGSCCSQSGTNLTFIM